jgi:hypothetical protein
VALRAVVGKVFLGARHHRGGELLLLKAELLFSKCHYSEESCHCHHHLQPLSTASLTTGSGGGRGPSAAPGGLPGPQGQQRSVALK